MLPKHKNQNSPATVKRYPCCPKVAGKKAVRQRAKGLMVAGLGGIVSYVAVNYY